MGYGGPSDRFSDCSIAALNMYFSINNGQYVSCLTERYSEFRSNYETGPVRPDLGCSYHDCVSILGLTTDYQGRIFNGHWDATGCHNGEAYYVSTEVSQRYQKTFYLCYSTSFQKYVISDTLCHTGWPQTAEIVAYNWNSGADLMAAQSSWMVLASSDYAKAEQVVVSSCSGNAARENMDCLEADYSDGFGDALCLSTRGANRSLWNGARQLTFERNSVTCSLGRGVFQFE